MFFLLFLINLDEKYKKIRRKRYERGTEEPATFLFSSDFLAKIMYPSS